MIDYNFTKCDSIEMLNVCVDNKELIHTFIPKSEDYDIDEVIKIIFKEFLYNYVSGEVCREVLEEYKTDTLNNIINKYNSVSEIYFYSNKRNITELVLQHDEYNGEVLYDYDNFMKYTPYIKINQTQKINLIEIIPYNDAVHCYYSSDIPFPTYTIAYYIDDNNIENPNMNMYKIYYLPYKLNDNK